MAKGYSARRGFSGGGGMAQQQIQAQPDAAHRQSHQRQTHQHFLSDNEMFHCFLIDNLIL